MAKQENVHQSDLRETRDPRDGGNADSMKEIEPYLSLLNKRTKEVQDAMASCKFNNEQCGYLADKLKVVVENAGLYLRSEVCSSGDGYGGQPAHQLKVGVQCASSYPQHLPCSAGDAAKCVEIFKLVLTFGKQIESFIKSCCKDKWIEAAMTLTNMSEYVSSLGFNLELCRIAVSNVCAGETEILKVDELDKLNKTEAAIVKLKVLLDSENLCQLVKKERDSSTGNTELANILLQKLAGEEPSATSEGEQGFWRKLLKYLTPGFKQVGIGASATVEEAEWLGIRVAEKIFKGAENGDFLKEVEILRQLSHPNVMSMFCFRKEERWCSIVMELMDGDLGNLIRKRLREERSPLFPIWEAVNIMLQIGEGVNYLHCENITHRDLKSKNILVKSLEGKSTIEHVAYAKVADFGISKANMRDLTYSNQTYNTGTCRWMPPEVINTPGSAKGQSGTDQEPKYPFKSDTYSFAMVCYEILSGYEPFRYERESSNNDIKDRVIKGDRPEFPPDCLCPPMLKLLIERCWSKDPKERPTFDFICKHLKRLKYLLMIGANEEAHQSAARELKEAADEARKQEEEREQAAVAAKRREDVNKARLAIDALSPLERGAQARERALQQKAAASNAARKQLAAAKSREKAAMLDALSHGRLRVTMWPTPEQLGTARKKIQYKPGKYHVAVCGTSGSGKSSLINAFRDLSPRDEGGAGVGITETTFEVTRYPDPRTEYPYSRYVWYDIPGAGTATVPDGQYFEAQGLFAFDLIILVYGERFTNIDVDIFHKCIRLGVDMFIVRSKSDQHILNMINAETDDLPDDDDYVKAKYIEATKSDFDMRKEVMAEVLFEDEPDLRFGVLKESVYLVSAKNIRGLMQKLRVKEGGGVNSNKIIDDARLVEGVLRRASVASQVSLQVNMCCSKCEEKIMEEASEVYGVQSVRIDRRRNRVIVTGNVDEHALLRKLRRIKPKAKFVE